ncbi:MAG: hypothetical protein DI538_25825 [Azospira oryzae]|jgi:hypothetical protein|nr:MAG: hypothetical protein DI538_25825 [Azospira oryzae]
MTANMIKGKGFKGALRYNLAKVEKNVAEVLANSFQSVSQKTILYEVQMIKAMRPNLKKFFYHTSINFPPSENFSNDTMRKIGEDYLKESGFTQHQFIMFRHHDADHPHLHILVNRIGYDGKVLSDSNDFARTEKILRQLEKKYHLTEVISSRQATERAMTKNELEMMKRTNTPSHKIQMQVLIREVLSSKPKLTSSEFIQALEKKGINVLFNQATTGYVSGISYSYGGMTITGSKLGNDFKWTTIKSVINYEQERDRAAIHQTNTRTERLDTNARTSAIDPEGNSTTLLIDTGKQQATDNQHQDTKRNNGRYTKASKRSVQASGFTNPTIKGNDSQSSSNSKGFNLAALLDGHTHGNLINVAYQPDLDIENPIGLKFKRKKRKKGKRS